MKKQTLAAAALALLLLAGCTAQSLSYDDTESGGQPESGIAHSESVLPDSSTSSFLAGEESKSPVVSEVPEAEKPSASPQEQTETQPPTGSSEPREETQPQTSATSSQPVITQEEKEPVSQPEQPQSTTPTTSEPVTSESQTEPTPTQPELPIFDVFAYVQAAKEYGTQIGLALDSTATACWDDPLTANAGCLYLTRDLQDRLDWYKQSGFTAFWVWSEQVAAGEYLVYIGYA